MYPDAINLPFNGAVIRNDFIPHTPTEAHAGEPGFWLILQGNALVVEDHGGTLTLPELLPAGMPAELGPLLIGTWQRKPVRALRICKEQQLPTPLLAEPFNAVEERLDDRLLTLGGLAQQILHWEKKSTVCSRCGGAMERITATWGKRCSRCHFEHFPHIHPCVIVLVRKGEKFLLARKAEWPAGRFSLVAGFLDFGECLEECVAREVKEETGVEVTNIRYVGSQNWPFPSQLMAAFVADYAGGEIRVDQAELEDARWFSPSHMPVSLPASRSIARWIIERYGLENI
jgi:NAD+ diphosphatase